MGKKKKQSHIKGCLIFIFILILLCTAAVVLDPQNANFNFISFSSSAESSSLDSITSPEIDEDNDVISNDSADLESDSLLEEENENFSQEIELTTESDSELVSDLVSEDQPDAPNLNYETSGSSYDDIMVNVLTCLLTKDTATLSEYVGTLGLRLSPTGSAATNDVVLSASQVVNFFDLGTQDYGIYPGSGETIRLTPSEYYNKYLVPTDFDFSLAVVSYNDANDIAAASTVFENPKTVSYEYTPNVMEWKRLIVVYCSEGAGDVLCGMIYQDVTTN